MDDIKVGQYWDLHSELSPGLMISMRYKLETYCPDDLLGAEMGRIAADGTKEFRYFPNFPAVDGPGSWTKCAVQTGQVWEVKDRSITIIERVTIGDWNETVKIWGREIEYQPGFAAARGQRFFMVEEELFEKFVLLPNLELPKFHLPHACNRCGSPAYITFKEVECSSTKCVCYVKPRPL